MYKIHALFILVTTAFGTVPATATITQPIGGPGGSPFTIECPPGQAVAGLHAQAGSFVDGLGLVCKPISGSPNRVGWAGGGGGGPQEAYCSSEKYMTGFSMTFTRGNGLRRQFVNTVGLYCETSDRPEACILSGDTDIARGDPDIIMTECYGRDGGGGIGTQLNIGAAKLLCPTGEVLTGIHGRQATYIDALGAICGARPALARSINTQPPGLPTSTDASRLLSGSEATGAYASPYGSSISTQVGSMAGSSSIDSDAVRIVEGQPQSPDASEWLEERPGYPGAPAYSPTTDRPSSFGSGPRSTQTISSNAGQSILPQVGQCRSGYVWREAGPGDLICVTPTARERARLENDLAVSRIDPNSAYGPHGCRSGFVWREGFPGDLACVPPQSRADAAHENAVHHQNRQ